MNQKILQFPLSYGIDRLMNSSVTLRNMLLVSSGHKLRYSISYPTHFAFPPIESFLVIKNSLVVERFHPVPEVLQKVQTVLPCVLYPSDAFWKPVLVNINTVDMHLPALFAPPLSTVTTYLLIAFSISRTLQQVGSPHDRILSITLLYIQYCFL